jgi:DNA-binding response OmpR family regulator
VTSIETRKEKILIVDDEAPMRELLQEALSGKGYDLLTAVDGKDALDQVLGQQPDLILMDIRMPKLDGVTLCKALRVYKETRTTPIIILTAFGSRDRLEECIAAGADDFIAKPFDVLELRIRVRAMLKLKHVSDEVERLQKYILALRELRGEVSSPESNT